MIVSENMQKLELLVKDGKRKNSGTINERPKSDIPRREFLQISTIAGLLLASGDLGYAQSSFDPVYGPPINSNFQDQERERQTTGQKFKFLGIVYDVPLGTKVVAGADGTILDIQNREIGGLSIFQEHGDAFVSFYSNLREIAVKHGQYVKRGQHLAENGPVGGGKVHYGFGRLFSGEDIRPGIKATLWIDPNTLGENNSRLKLYTGKDISDKVPKEQRIYYKSLVQKVLEEKKVDDVPAALKPYFEKSILWPSEVSKMLRDNTKYFNDGTYQRFVEGFRKMTDPGSQVPVVLTHPIMNPNLK